MTRRRTKAPDRTTKGQLVEARRAKARRVLEAYGLWDAARRAGLHAHPSVIDRYFPRVAVRPAPGAGRDADTAALLDALERAVRTTAVPFPPLGDRVPVTDVVSHVLPLARLFEGARGGDPGVRAFLALGAERMGAEATLRAVETALRALHRELFVEALKASRIDRRLFRLRLEVGEDGRGREAARFEAGDEPARRRTVTTESGPRPAFQCGGPWGGRVEWVEWPPSAVGGPGGPPLPVYVQGHALDRLYRHPAEARLLGLEGGWGVQNALFLSLREPRVVGPAARPGRHLVEFRMGPHRLGYLVAGRAGDVVLVETFLFLTMDGTPEGRMLRDRLRLARLDKEALGLDRAGTFFGTDLRSDPAVVAALAACGCGHLFEVVRELPRDQYLGGYAADTRRYLGLGG